MGHYDLYGNSYRTAREAANAESAQCAEIDADIANQKAVESMNRQQQSEYYLYEKISELESRIAHLEKITNKLNPA